MHQLPGEKRKRISFKVSLKNILSKWLFPIISIVFPSRCQICGEFIENPGERVVCGDCLERAEIYQGDVCQVCGRFFYFRGGKSTVCLECLNDPPWFQRHRSAGHYAGTIKQMIILFKYKQHESLKKPLAEFLLKSHEARKLIEGVDLVIPVPLHASRQKERGFNQSELLAEEIARKNKLPLDRRRLVKTRKTVAQVSLEAEERRNNLLGAFTVRQPEKIAGRVILLVDDVFTTGSTCRECSRTLLEAGAKEVRVLTLARA